MARREKIERGKSIKLHCFYNIAYNWRVSLVHHWLKVAAGVFSKAKHLNCGSVDQFVSKIF